MKSIILLIVVFAFSCVGGFLTGSWTSYKQHEDLMKETADIGQTLFSPKTEQSEFEMNVSLANSIYEATQNNDHESLLKLACIQLMFNAEKLNPEVWVGASKYEYARELRSLGVSNLLELREMGYCE